MACSNVDVDVSHVSALTRAARKQMHGMHHARAVELLARALAAAEALGQPDCLVVASLRQVHLDEQFTMVATDCDCDGDDASKLAAAIALLSTLEAHLPAVFETLERRRAQGTLCAGRCRAHEVAWSAGFAYAEALPRVDEASRKKDSSDEEHKPLYSQHVGVEAYFAAAKTAVRISAWLMQARPQPDPLTAACLTFIERALQFALQPVSVEHGDQTFKMVTSVESFFLHNFRKDLLPHLKPEAPGCAGVLVAWRDLERNGPLLRWLLGDKMRANIERLDTAHADAQAAKDARTPLRSCALPSCDAREAHVAHFKKCGACGVVFYCSKEHQTEHWPAHKAACKAARKAAANNGQAAGEGSASSSQQGDA